MPETTVQKMSGAIASLDELDETPTEELDRIVGRKGGKEPPDERAENDCDEHLDVERRIPVTTS